MSLSPKIEVITFGCKVNTYDSSWLQSKLSSEFSNSDTEIFVLNSCAVTAEASRDAFRTARRIKRKKPNAKVVLTGCAAQVDTSAAEAVDEIDLIVANSHKGQIRELIQVMLQSESFDRVHKSNIFKKEDLEDQGGVEESHTRAFVKIQDGCNSFCTFCVIPFARGKSRSLSPHVLAEKLNQLYDQGIREVALTGVHIGDYEYSEGSASSMGLEGLIQHLLSRTRMPRLRLSSLEPVEVTDPLLELYQDPRLCRHFHMSIQSAETQTLSAMKRKYTAEDVERALLKIDSKVPGSFVGMDLIAGFPTETESQFAETADRLTDLPWTRLHVFPYSERPGTYASKTYPNLPNPEVKRRGEVLRSLSDRRLFERSMAQIGLRKEALVLRKPAHGAQGLSRDYWPILLPEMSESQLGTEISVSIQGISHGRLVGELISPGL